jgi:hypothetical protein
VLITGDRAYDQRSARRQRVPFQRPDLREAIRTVPQGAESSPITAPDIKAELDRIALSLRIVWIYRPALTYGDRGNMLILARRSGAGCRSR